MSRIRSTHPGQWTDEEFVACSPFARLLALGLRNEADDQGIFEWNPIKLKMRLLPADNIDMVALLSELIERNQVAKYEVGGRSYGAIRNFRKYQRPKSPNALYPLPRELRIYVALDKSSQEIGEDDDTPIPPSGEIAPQMEEEGGSKERETRARGSPTLSDDAWAIAAAILSASGKTLDEPESQGLVYAAQTWLNEKIPKDFILARAMPVAGKHVNYLSKTVRSAWAEHQLPPKPVPSGDRHAAPTKRSAIAAHLDRRIREFGEAEREGVGGADEGSHRLLSHG